MCSAFELSPLNQLFSVDLLARRNCATVSASVVISNQRTLSFPSVHRSGADNELFPSTPETVRVFTALATINASTVSVRSQSLFTNTTSPSGTNKSRLPGSDPSIVTVRAHGTMIVVGFQSLNELLRNDFKVMRSSITYSS